jgi:chromatin remodeling complex protein RSC6
MARAKVRKVSRKRAYNSAFMKPLTPDAHLAEIVGKEPLPRTEATKRVWGYIRMHNLQDPGDKRTIIADAKLRPVFGGRASVSMFELSREINRRLRFRTTTDGDDTTGFDP